MKVSKPKLVKFKDILKGMKKIIIALIILIAMLIGLLYLFTWTPNDIKVEYFIPELSKYKINEFPEIPENIDGKG